jgi:hypothetical protein
LVGSSISGRLIFAHNREWLSFSFLSDSKMPTAPRPPPNQHRNAQIRHCEYPYPPITRIFRVVQAIPPSHAKFLGLDAPAGRDLALYAIEPLPDPVDAEQKLLAGRVNATNHCRPPVIGAGR